MVKKFDTLERVKRLDPIGGKGELESIALLSLEEFKGKGRMFAHNFLKPGSTIGLHTHKGDFEIYYILNGEGIFVDNDKEVQVSKGDVLITYDGESHSLKNTGDKDIEFLACIIYT
ncbi:Cupin 2 conserved barrel domain protein [Thermodesulfobium narugense DSM 14796]|uniref:Cupin 2 conserved barrel domain protein n=1 Tax=Thermodesulfobium narugense DSM 14796 TaxID=747365 RepID=M1E6H7_9BACT|nr:cupin domain-containing protein [Thermodesulfobium narugense]AEE14015.1 Cupin 2 conserved barrel domain protein [Thermodesulfobium narugense DSM 14796]